MGVDTEIHLPPATRLRDVASVIATLHGHPTKYVNHREYESCDVVGVKLEGIVEMPTCAWIKLLREDGEGYRKMLYQFESSRTAGSHVMLIRSVALNIAVGRRLVEFFGGTVGYQDCSAVGIDLAVPAPQDSYPEDGKAWNDFERRKSEVKPLTREEISECEKWAAYKNVERNLPWLAGKGG